MGKNRGWISFDERNPRWIDGGEYAVTSVRVLTGDICAYNDFDAPDTVKPAEMPVPAGMFDGNGTEFIITVPACGVVTVKAVKS